MKLLHTDIKNKVLQSMMNILDRKREAIIAANRKDLDLFDKTDRAMYDRLIVNDKKVDGMIQSI
ncbi:MAG: glutamate-5-semialdehyde dehydrogenase, partial [Candidatus Paceibacteria bacterium]